MCPQFDQLMMSQISLQYFAKACLWLSSVFSLSWSQSRNCQRRNCAEAGSGKLLSWYFCTPLLFLIEGTPAREYYIQLSKIIQIISLLSWIRRCFHRQAPSMILLMTMCCLWLSSVSSLSWSQSRNCQRWNCAEAGDGKLLSRYFCTPSLYQIEGTPEREYYIHLSKIIHNWC